MISSLRVLRGRWYSTVQGKSNALAAKCSIRPDRLFAGSVFAFINKKDMPRFRGFEDKMKILETARCYVREITPEDVPDEIDLYDRSPHMTDYISPLMEEERQREYQKLYVEQIYGVYGYGMWAVFDKETDRLIGEAGLEHRIDINREKFPYDWMFEEGCAELGFCFDEALWGQGYCTEVCREILKYGSGVLGLDTVFARAEEDNPASIRVLTKLGFEHYEGRYYVLQIKGRHGK